MRQMIIAVAAATLVLQGCSTLSDTSAKPDAEKYAKYVGNNSDSRVLTATGDCLRASGWASENMAVECQASSKVMAAEPEKVPVPQQVAKLSYDGTALFAFDSAELSTDGRRELNNLIAKLNSNSTIDSVAVVGHADSIGTLGYNQSLSERRAATVRQYLESSLKGISVLTTGMGETAPVADNSTSEGRKLNRRVEVRINATGSKAVFN